MDTATTTIILQVQLGAVNDDEQELLKIRFHRFYDRGSGQIQYPCTGDSHAEDVFTDEFTRHPSAVRRSVDYAAVIEMPYPVEQFVPFTEDSSGAVLFELT